jgi:XTP/dITP diphosphohydrolase
MDLVMIQFLFQKKKTLTFGEMSSKAKYNMDHRFNAFKKIKKFL